MAFDLDFDYWADVNPDIDIWQAKGSTDPDSQSKPLQQAHKRLWSKPLPNGEFFDLEEVQGTQLQWRHFRMSSDAISNSYMTSIRLRPIIAEADKHAEELFRAGSKIGGFSMFPAYRINRRNTINGARGMNQKIGDRMDLTLEAIRRHYINQPSPLTETLDRYADFFELFNDFKGYIDFWLLNDLVGANYQIKFYLPFDDFSGSATPADLNEYMQIKNASVSFLNARTARIGRTLAEI